MARYRGEADGAGVWLDPTADKIFILALFWWFGCQINDLFAPGLFWLLVAVEVGGRLLIFIVWKLQGKKIEQDNVKAKWWGKVKFGLQITLGIGLFGWFIWPQVWWRDFFDSMFWVIIALAVVSVASHIWEIPEPFRKNKKI